MTMVIILICRLTYVSRDYGTYNICLMCLILSLHPVGYMYCLICEHYYHICIFLMCLILSVHSVGYMYCLINEYYHHICICLKQTGKMLSGNKYSWFLLRRSLISDIFSNYMYTNKNTCV